MNSKEIKQVRGQIRQVIKELLPDLLATELLASVEGRLSKTLHGKVELIAKSVKESMDNIDQRSKDLQSYLVRQAPVAMPASPSAPAETQSDANTLAPAIK